MTPRCLLTMRATSRPSSGVARRFPQLLDEEQFFGADEFEVGLLLSAQRCSRFPGPVRRGGRCCVATQKNTGRPSPFQTHTIWCVEACVKQESEVRSQESGVRI
jgi:hypothetical protein